MHTVCLMERWVAPSVHSFCYIFVLTSLARCFVMMKLVVFRVIIFCLLGLVMITSCMYVVQIMCYIDRDTSKELSSKVDFVISSLKDVLGPPINGSKCRKPFTEYSSAYSVPMSTTFKNKVNEFTRKVRSVARKSYEQGSFQWKSEYQLYHHLAIKLKFVHTVCETGMYPFYYTVDELVTQQYWVLLRNII